MVQGGSSTLLGMDLLGRLERDFLARRSSGALAGALRRWQARHERLRRFDDLEAVVGACREGRGPGEAVDAALSALCQEATAGDEDAAVLLIWLLLPGFLLARSRLTQMRVLTTEEVTAEMVAGVWVEARRVTPSAKRVASRLVNSARWRALGAVREAIDWAGRVAPIPDEVAELDGLAGYSPPASESDPATDAVRDEVLSPEEGLLVHADHHALVEISEGLGISLDAARKRRTRARARLRVWLNAT